MQNGEKVYVNECGLLGWGECGRASESESRKWKAKVRRAEVKVSGEWCVVGKEGAVGAVGAAPTLGHTGTVGWEEGEN